MNDLSLLAWAVLVSFTIGATVVFMILAPQTKSFSVGRKIAGGLAILVAVSVLVLPVLFIPSLGVAGFILSGAGILMAAISYWKWWVLWLPTPA